MIPWQVSLRLPDTNWHYCGGIILDSKTVLTAAHCNPWVGDKVYIGNPNRNYGGKNILIQRVIKNRYKPFNESSLEHDVLIIKLNKSIKFSHKVRPVCLPSHHYKPQMKDICYVSGWGVKSDTNPTASLWLMYNKMKILSNDKCRALYYWIENYGYKITKDMLCANSEDGVAVSGAGACYGDSGGPLVCLEDGKPVIAGIVSFGYGCGRAYSPGVYARVTSYRRFIRASMKKK